MPSAIPAVAYYRMSREKQDKSIGDQRVAVEKYAKAKGYRILRDYVDPGISGWKAEERIDFQRMITDAMGGDFRAVLVWDQDRFSRFDPMEANHYWYLLDKAKVKLVTVAQGVLDWHDLGGWLTASVMQHGKAQYCKDLARNICRGQRRSRIVERRILSNPPIGYARDEELHLIPGPADQVALIRRIFALRVAGAGLYLIAATLNAEGVPTPRGRTWSKQSIKHILNRETYAGRLVIGKESHAKFERLVAEPVIIENDHEAIIDERTWARVQEMSTERRRTHARHGGEGARLGGLIRCGCCGAGMYAVNQRRSQLYVCGAYHSTGRCSFNSLPRAVVEAAVFSKIRERLLLGSRERLEAAIERGLERRRPAAAPSRQGELAKLDAQIATATERMLLVDADMLDVARRKIVELRKQRDAVAPAKAPSGPLPSARAIAADVWRLDAVMREAPAAAVREALGKVVDHIRLDFQEHGSTAKRRRFRCTGGEITLSTKTGHLARRPSP